MRKKKLIEILKKENSDLKLLIDVLKKENVEFMKENVKLSRQSDNYFRVIQRIDDVLKNPFMRHETVLADGRVVRAVSAVVRFPKGFYIDENIIKEQMVKEFASQLFPYVDIKFTCEDCGLNDDQQFKSYKAVLYLLDKTELYNQKGIIIISDPKEIPRRSPFLNED